MKVLFIAYRDFKNPSAAGGDLYLWELAKGLSKLGHQATMICSSFEGAKSTECIEGVTIVRIKGSWTLPLFVFNEYITRCKGNFDIVVEEAIGGQRFPFLSTLYVKEPLVAVWHQRHRKIFRQQYPLPAAILLSLFELLQARLYRSRTIITPSKGAKEEITLLGFSPNKVKVVYDGLGGIFCYTKQTKYRENIIVWLGKLRRYKRPDHAIMALQRVLENARKPCKLVIAGKISEIDEQYVDELKGIAEKMGVGNHVQFELNISETEKMRLLEQSRVLVQPSPVEGFSIVVIEANRCGTPVVASDGVPRDVVIENYNGLVYPFGAIEDLAKALIKLLGDDHLWKRLSKNSVIWSQNFTWEKSSNNLNTILGEVLSVKAD